MLKVVEVKGAGEKQLLLDAFTPGQHTWLVSDLKSKFELQNRLLARHQILNDHSILRANEFWRHFLVRHFPQWRVVSMDFVRSFIQSEIEQMQLEWVKGTQTASQLVATMGQLLPLLVQLEDQDLLDEWLKSNQDSYFKWAHWYHLSRHLWQKVLAQKILPSTWIPAFLSTQDFELSWPYAVTVDLSAQLTLIESLLLQRLSEKTEVSVLRPAADWQGAYSQVLKNYQRFESFQFQPVSREQLKSPGAVKVRHFSTALAEVKDAVAHVRKWLDEGIELDRIAIVASEIESYWPMLLPTLTTEGIPVHKAQSIALHTLKVVQVWMARVRLKMGRVQREDLELATFSSGQPQLNFDEFKRIFTHFYGEEQLQLVPDLASQFEQNVSPQLELTRDEFIVHAGLSWPDSDTAYLEKIIHNLLADGSGDSKMPYRLWVSWLESWVARLEEEVQPAEAGVECVNLLACEWLNTSHVYFLGANEESLRTTMVQGIGIHDAEAIERDLGFIVPHPENDALEFELRALLDRSLDQVVLSFAKSDPHAQPVTPSRLWLIHCDDPKKKLKEIDAPLTTRWDELQSASAEEIALTREWPSSHINDLLTAMEVDLGRKEPAPFHSPVGRNISASSLEDLSRCPFIFAAKRLFLLEDLPALDLDLDPLTSGQLIHSLFEKLTEEPIQLSRSNDEIAAILEKLREENRVIDMGLWNELRGRLVELGQRFLAAESRWRSEFPKTKTVARELSYKFAWRPSTGEWLAADKLDPKSDFLVRGRIDRVDSDGNGDYVILDYKSSSAKVVGAESWIKNDALQLALYGEVFRRGLLPLPEGRLSGIFYYVAKNMSRRKGWQAAERSELLPEKGPRGTQLDVAKTEKVRQDFQNRIVELVDRIERGELSPSPKETNECHSCSWRELCRFPRLN